MQQLDIDIMDENSCSSSVPKAGIYRNLMMPGFTDAGAATAYAPKPVIARRTAASATADISNTTPLSNSVDVTDNGNHDILARGDETFSEAATELHDNRTKRGFHNAIAHHDRYYPLKSSVLQGSGASTRRPEKYGNVTVTNMNSIHAHKKDGVNHNASGESIEVEATFGFFPSTKPPPSPSPRVMSGNRSGSIDIHSTSSNSDNNNSNIPRCSSPQPISPPHVTRKQLMMAKRSSATSSTIKDNVEDTIVFPSKSSETPNHKTSGVSGKAEGGSGKISKGDDDNQRTNSSQCKNSRNNEEFLEKNHPRNKRIQMFSSLDAQPFIANREMKREVSTFSLAPDIGVVEDTAENEVNLELQKQRGGSNSEQQQNDEYKIKKYEEIVTQQHQQNRPQTNERIKENDTRPSKNHSANYMNDSCDDDDESSSLERNNHRRLDSKALQEMDRIDDQRKFKDFKSFGNTKSEYDVRDDNKAPNADVDEGIDKLSTSSSMVSSTCSEFGTVIQMGDATMAARMKEVEEMELAALAETEGCYSENQTKSSQLSSSSSIVQPKTFLDPPILESSPSSRKSGYQSNGQNIECQQLDSNTTVASANSTVSPGKRNPMKSEMVSAAFRRIGHIHRLNINNRGERKIRNSYSAPTTPLRRPASNPSKQPTEMSAVSRESSSPRFKTKYIGNESIQAVPPPSFVLRSPGSYARISLDSHHESSSQQCQQKKDECHRDNTRNQKKTILSPRFASFLRGRENGVASSSIAAMEKANLPSHEDLVIPPLEQRPATARLTPRVLPLDSSSSVTCNRVDGYFSGPLRLSKSLDFSRNGISSFPGLPSTTAQHHHLLYHSFPSPTNAATTSSSMEMPDLASTEVNLQGRINSDFSLSKYLQKPSTMNSIIKLQQPQRIEIEREDALDILACLVEQGIADWNTSIDDQNINTASGSNQHSHGDAEVAVIHHDVDKSSTSGVVLSPSGLSTRSVGSDKKETMKDEEKDEAVASKQILDLEENMHSSDSDSTFHNAIEDLKIWVEDKDHDDETNKEHQRRHRKEVIQKLIKSHSYAVEMKRASLSASTWLKSIGRGHGPSKDEVLRDSESSRDHAITTNSTNSTKVKCGENHNKNATNAMESLTLKAMLHNIQLELTETKQINSVLNEELSKCRAEIGRIKSVSRSGQTTKSILDDSDRSSDSSRLEALSKESPANRITKIPQERQPKEYFTNDCTKGHISPALPKESSNEEGMVVLQSLLEKANETIRGLHRELRKNADEECEDEIDIAPVVEIPSILSDEIKPRSTASSPDPIHRTVNVHMLDGENFVTDWDELRTLPPPPDHSLQSPIVSAVLEQWTQDRSLHESLLAWIDNVMTVDDLENLPPLTISSLNHQVRDGFTMHVLPHLLRRADIHVTVQTRTQRHTTYDMSVTVCQKKESVSESSRVLSLSSNGNLQQKDIKSQQQLSLMDRRDSMSGDESVNRFEPKFSVAESDFNSAVTEHTANLLATPKKQPVAMSDRWDQQPQTPLQADYSEFSSQLRSGSRCTDAFSEGSQHYVQRQHEPHGNSSSGTIMGALGGALSGLLSRNKYAVSPGRVNPPQTRYVEDNRNLSSVLPASLRAQMDLTSSPTPGSTGYHRVGQLEDTLSAAIDDQRQCHQKEESQPYHRVVSAPPGRIGVTFVEFRGHAMVSDVAIDSPLAGWIFPSDILIAVDEIPVSGMRVRDIVNILSTRKNRQRAMRVISSHAMNEFTMMSQISGPLNEENDEDE